MSLFVSVSIALFLSVCVCVCVCLCLCFCLSLVIWFRHEFISVCVSGGPDSTDHRADFLTFYFFNEDITYVCNICGVGVTYKMVWSKYQNCIRYVSYVTYHTHTRIYIYMYIYILVHSAHTTVPHSFMLMSAFASHANVFAFELMHWDGDHWELCTQGYVGGPMSWGTNENMVERVTQGD